MAIISHRLDSRSGSQSGLMGGSGSDGGTSNGTMGTGGPKVRKAKTVTHLDSAREALLQEPSGWGDLPSPKPEDNDNGTELWGIPPADTRDKGKGRGGAGRWSLTILL